MKTQPLPDLGKVLLSRGARLSGGDAGGARAEHVVAGQGRVPPPRRPLLPLPECRLPGVQAERPGAPSPRPRRGAPALRSHHPTSCCLRLGAAFPQGIRGGPARSPQRGEQFTLRRDSVVSLDTRPPRRGPHPRVQRSLPPLSAPCQAAPCALSAEKPPEAGGWRMRAGCGAGRRRAHPVS